LNLINLNINWFYSAYINPMSLRLGHNMYTDHGKDELVNYTLKTGANFFQIFMRPPYQFRSQRWSDAELITLKNQLEKHDRIIVIHGNFVCNFCNPPGSFIHEFGGKLLIEELNDSYKLGALGTIIHMGKRKIKINKKETLLSEDNALKNFVKGVRKVLQNSHPKSTLILETGAGQGSEICTSIKDLSLLYHKFTDNEKKRIMFCIDTCHVFVAGCNLANELYIDFFMELIEYYLGWNKVACVHLNDSDAPYESCKDRHADIGRGHIGEKGLKKLIKLLVIKKIPMVMETPRFYYINNIKIGKNPDKNNPTDCERYEWKEQLDLIKSWLKTD